ncbi:RNA pseudouridine synthase [uncultured Arenimonas sp.]|uniref:RNA pseudouridine synthase n=1 Tax=uncultured Arenimonas sp. TaxID=546226 RepID=UPI0030DA964C
MTDPVRLARRVVEITGCTRSEAERYVQGGWVTVDGVVVEAPQHPVTTENVALLPDARPDPAEPATMLLHKPAGYDPGPGANPAEALLVPENRWADDPSGWRLLQRHFPRLQPAMPLPLETSGLMVFSQDGRVLQKLKQDGERIEQEFNVEVEGELAPYGWKRLTGGTSFQGWPVAPFRVSWQSEQRLRFAIKGVRPGLLEYLCAEVGLKATAVHRLRIGRVGLSKMPVGQWRYLPVLERF